MNLPAHPLWAWLPEAADGTVFGGKAAGLARATRAGLPVPRGIALSTELVDLIVANDAAAAEDIKAAVTTLGESLAVRSSASGEDGASASFAGQYLTRLGVLPTRWLMLSPRLPALRRPPARPPIASVWDSGLRRRWPWSSRPWSRPT